MTDVGKMHGGERRKSSGGLTFDDILYEMETRQTNGGSESGVFSAEENSSPDVYELLAQKERDLLLAAELGKHLLDKNEELSKENEKIAEDFSQKLEELEQEKYHLRRRLESAQEEYDLRVADLQSDIASLRATLEDHTSSQRQAEREKSMLITTLSEQNQRLTAQLKESTKNEEALTSELQSLKDQINMKRSSMNDHVSHLDMLREEINMLTERKLDLERRIDLLQGEREGLSSTLDESADRIVMLEKQSREQDSIIRTNNKVMDELRATNLSLSERLDSVHRSLSLSPSHQQQQQQHMSLMNEMDISDSERSLNASRRPFSQIDEELDADVECDNPETHLGIFEMKELKSEALSAYQQMKTLCGNLRQREKQRRRSSDSLDTSSSSEDTNPASFKAGLLNEVVKELRGLLHDLLRKESKGTCLTCGGDTNEKLKLEIQLHKTTENFEKLERTMKQKEDELKRKEEEILDLKSKLSVTEVKLSAACEERDTLREDIGNTAAGKDELIKKAWDVRDAAVKRKNNTEIELARTRIDVMQVNSQLLEAIQQKVELSQQLDQWQVDMEELLEEQMMKKMKAHEKVKSGAESDSSQTESRKRTSRILSFFQR